MSRALSRPLKITAITVASAIALFVSVVVGLVFWVVLAPQSVWNFASRYVLPSDLTVTWDKIHYEAKRQTWRQWDLNWSTENLAVQKKNPSVDVGITAAEFKFSLNIWTDKPFLDFEVLRVIVRDPSRFVLPESEDEPSEKSLYQTVEGYLGYLSQSNRLAVINTIEIRIPHLEIIVGEAAPLKMKGEITKSLQEREDLPPMHFTAMVERDAMKIDASGVLVGENYETENEFIKIKLAVRDKSWKVEGDLSGRFFENVLVLSGEPQFEYWQGKKITHADPFFEIKMSPSSLDLTLRAKVIGIPGPIVRLDKVTGSVVLPLENDVAWSSKPAVFKVESPVDLFLIDKDMRPPLEKACRCKLPEEFQVSLNGQVWLDKLLAERAPQKEKVAHVNLEVESVKNKLFSADVAASAEVFMQDGQWLLEPTTDAKVTVFSFQGLRQFLDAKGVLIPAPLDVLDGMITLTAQSPVTRAEKHMATEANIAVDLSSPAQKVLIESSVILHLANNFKKLDVDVNAIIKQLQLELPPLDPVLGIPPLVEDSRVLRKPKPRSGGGFTVNVSTNIRTESNGVIRLLNKYAKPHAPLTVNASSEGTATSGFIRLEPFVIEYLRRVVNVESLEISLKENEQQDLPLAGRFRIEQGGYKIFVLLGGTVKSPSVKLDSDPYLPKSDIISVLLYGRISDQLVSGEAEAAGSFNAAMADRAIGLIGLWAFATTPIQSFSYNAVTKVYTATVNLGGGLTAGVGTNWEQATNLELRKRVSKRWVLTASWAPTRENKQEGRLVLQWERRF